MNHTAQADSIARDTLRTIAEHADSGELLTLHSDGTATLTPTLWNLVRAACAVVLSADDLTIEEAAEALGDGETEAQG